LASSTRDRISVDLRGMKAALLARAAQRGMSPSDLVREAVAGALAASPAATPTQHAHGYGGRVRLCLRMRSSDADATKRAARESGLSSGDFIASLVQAPREPSAASRPAAALAALTASCAELATLSRNLHELTRLLRHGTGRTTADYRKMLDSIDAQVRTHLDLATVLLAQLRPLLQFAPKEESR
jgi:hypothetical protein